MVVVTDESAISDIIRREVLAAVGAVAADPPREVLDTAQAAEYLRVSRSYLERARVEGGGPVYCKLANLVRYRRGDLDSWLAELVVANTSQRRAGG